MNKPFSFMAAAILTGLLFVVQTSSPAAEAGGAALRGISAPLLARIVAAEKNRETWESRKEALLAYGVSVNAGNERSLREFTGGDDAASLAIEQGKAALVFHLLRKLAGEDKFSRVLGALSSRGASAGTSWDEIRGLFEKETGADLGWFFTQWIDWKGLPDLDVENASARRSGSRFEVSFDLAQKGKAYRFALPVSVSFMGGGVFSEIVKIDSEKKHVVLLVDEEPALMTIDRDYDVPRRLSDEETPPMVASLLGDTKPLLIPPASNREVYAPIIASLKKRGAEEKDAASIKDSEIRTSSLVLLGKDNPLAARLFGGVEASADGFSIVVKKNPWNAGKTAVLVQARSAAEAEAALPKISEYAEYSSLAFDRGSNVSKKIDGSQRGLEMELREPTGAIDLSTLKTLPDVIEAAAGKRIVYVGEYHDKYAHHLVELQVIRELARKNAKLAIGMEMFQRPFQKVLDEFINGSIDEREFLKRSEYFKRWGFDYNLYKPILDFARDRKIPVVALNIRKEITDKVSKSGMDSLTEEEKKEVPPQLDFSDEEYRDRLKEIFSQHKNHDERSFDFFYQAQVLWDETMAASVDEYLKKNPGSTMVVVAGGGHLAYGSGIPKRAFRRNGLPYFIALNDGEADREIANYVILPQPLEGTAAPRLMAMLKADDKKVSVIDLPEDSVSGKAGIKVGDTILALDEEKVESVEDIKLMLFYKKQGGTVNVTVLRKRFLLGDKKITIAVKL